MNLTTRCAALWAIFAIILPLGLFAQSSSGKKSGDDQADAKSESSIADYVLQPQDLIRVSVFQEEDINKQGEVGISSEHTITLPLIGTVNLRGKTVRQAEEMIRALYDKDYLVNPTVNVQVLKYSDRSVNVTGAVNDAGRVQFPPERGLTIADAITLAGGHSRLADLRKVKLTRKGPNGEPETRDVDVDAIQKKGARDVALEPGDQIFVPERII
jgi:polysaccharide export outer membrane protein